jgi:hypothetical protein
MQISRMGVDLAKNVFQLAPCQWPLLKDLLTALGRGY